MLKPHRTIAIATNHDCSNSAVSGTLICLLIAALMLGGAGAARGDGGFLAPIWYELYETSQTAFITYDADSGREELTVMPGFYGDVREFAWILPTPAPAEVSSADHTLFTSLTELTRPQYHERDSWNCERRDYVYDTADDIEIFNEAIVGVYAVMVVGATEADALVDSLTAWGYLHAANNEAAVDAITHYVDKDWSFVAMKVDSTALAELFPYGGYHRGQLHPVRLTFSSPEPVFPLRISAISAAAESKVHIYTRDRHRQTVPGFNTAYANRISATEAQRIRAVYPALGAVLTEGDFLTKLVRRFSPVEMTEDLVVTPAPRDDEILPVHFSGLPTTSFLLGGPAVVWLLRRRRFRR